MQYRDDSIEADPVYLAAMQKRDWTHIDQESRLQQLSHLFEIIDAQPVRSPVQGTERLVFVLKCRVIEPVAHVNRIHNERLIIGTEDDPDADRDETWSASASRWANSLNTLEKMHGITEPLKLKGKRFCAFVVWNDIYANLTNFAREGSVTPGETTPARNYAATKSRSKSDPTFTQSMQSAEVPCDNCHQMFPQSEMAAHLLEHHVNM